MRTLVPLLSNVLYIDSALGSSLVICDTADTVMQYVRVLFDFFI
jgi:hypothetical protein